MDDIRCFTSLIPSVEPAAESTLISSDFVHSFATQGQTDFTAADN